MQFVVVENIRSLFSDTLCGLFAALLVLHQVYFLQGNLCLTKSHLECYRNGFKSISLTLRVKNSQPSITTREETLLISVVMQREWKENEKQFVGKIHEYFYTQSFLYQASF